MRPDRRTGTWSPGAIQHPSSGVSNRCSWISLSLWRSRCVRHGNPLLPATTVHTLGAAWISGQICWHATPPARIPRAILRSARPVSPQHCHPTVEPPVPVPGAPCGLKAVSRPATRLPGAARRRSAHAKRSHHRAASTQLQRYIHGPARQQLHQPSLVQSGCASRTGFMPSPARRVQRRQGVRRGIQCTGERSPCA